MPPSQELPEHLPEVEAQRQFFDALRTPEGLVDLKKLLLAVDFPVYFLWNAALTFHLWGVNWGAAGQRVTDVSPTFVSPGPVAPTQVVMISNVSRDADPRQMSDRLTLLPTTKSLLVGYLPSKYGAAFTQRDHAYREREVERLWQERFARDLAGAPSVAAAPQFKAAHWDQPVPLSVAYRDLEKIRLVVGSVGVSQPEFLTILTSLVPLQADDNRLNKLEHERAAALEAVKQKGDQWA